MHTTPDVWLYWFCRELLYIAQSGFFWAQLSSERSELPKPCCPGNEDLAFADHARRFNPCQIGAALTA